MGSNAAVMASVRNAVGDELCVGLRVVDCRRFLVTLVCVGIAVAGVRCQSADKPAPAPQVSTSPESILNFPIFNQFEADALNAIFNKWTQRTPQLKTILNWSHDRHPCNSTIVEYYNPVRFEGAWRGVYCTAFFRLRNTTGDYYEVAVTTLMMYGSNSRCGWEYNSQCDFDGINGELPAEISQLINVQNIWMDNHPGLTGSVPPEIWHMPNLTAVSLQNNSLNGTLLSTSFNSSSKLDGIYLMKNKLSGRLELGSQGSFFSTSLKYLNLSENQLTGPVDLETFGPNNNLKLLDLSKNQFHGAFSTGCYFDLNNLFLSNNKFTSIKFANFTGKWAPTQSRKQAIVYMPSLLNLFLRNNKLSGPFPTDVLHMHGLEYLDLSGNQFFGTIDLKNMDKQWIANMKSLDLSRNNFSGSLDFQSVNVAMRLRDINFENNKLSGEFPAHILKSSTLEILYGSQNLFTKVKFPNIQINNSKLSLLMLIDNKLDEVQFPRNPSQFSISYLEVSNLLFLGHNPMCSKVTNKLLASICRLNQTSPVLDVVTSSKTKIIIIASTTTSAFLLLIFLLYIWRLIIRIKSLNCILQEFEKKEIAPNLYSYKQIKGSTNNFDSKNILGQGGFGTVYKGKLADGTIIAVKKLTMSSSKVLSDFLNEVVVISGLKHRNLVKLKGWCLGDSDQCILVFECITNKNLVEAISMEGNLIESPYLYWATRFKIIVGVAQGLAYLHEGLQSPIIHRDIKASNVLLTDDFEPKIADFGLAYFFPTLNDQETHLTLMEVAGTRGYWSPEYAIHGHISTALDVFSFGIVILEIISGRKNVDNQKSSEEVYLRDWAWKQFEIQELTTIIDIKMKYSSTDLEDIMRVLNVAIACVHYKAGNRPKMHNVVQMLLGNMHISDLTTTFENGDRKSVV